MFQFLRKDQVNTLRYLPSFLSRDTLFKNTAEICDDRHEKLRLKLIDIAQQFFIKTCTWGLDDWERVLAITTIKSDGYALRRNRILLKLQGWKTSSVDFMNELINRYTTSKNAYIVEHNEDFYFEIVLNVDTVENWSELVTALFTYKPAHLGMFIAMQIFLLLKIQHRAEAMQIVDARHCVWNLGTVRTARWDGEFNLAGKIRLDALVTGEGYKERQTHKAEINISVESSHKNDCRIINIFDGSFCLDGSHIINGARLLENRVNHCCVVENMKGVEAQ